MEGRNFAQKIRESGTSEFLDMTGMTSISQLGALISKFQKFITIDTGPAHIAYALKIPTVVLFLREAYKCWSPRNLDINRVLMKKILI